LKDIKAYLAPISLAILVMLYPLKGGDTLGLGYMPSFVALSLMMLGFMIRPRGRFVFATSDLAVFIYLLCLLFSVLVSGISEMSLRYLMQIFTLSIIPFVVVRVAGLTLEDSIRFIKVFPYVAIFSAVSMVSIVGSERLFSYSGYRLGTDEFNPVGIGYAFGISAFASFAAIKLRLCGLIVGGLSTTVSVAILILTGSRGSMLALVANLFVFMLVSRELNWRLLIILCVTGLAAYFVFNSLDLIMVSDRFTNSIESDSVQARFTSWMQALAMFQEQTLLGHGLGSFEVKHGEYVHNVILEHMANGGLLLTIPFLFLFLSLMQRVFNSTRGQSKEIVMILALLGVYAFTVRMFSLSMSNTKEIFLFLAMALACGQSLKRTQNN
jgi:O-antigen ligase